MALSDAHVKEPVGELGGKTVEARPPLHGGGNSAQLGVLLRQTAHGLAEDGGKVGAAPLEYLAGLHTEPSHPVELVRVALSRCIAFPLYCPDMEQHRALQVPGVGEKAGEPFYVMAVHGTKIGKAHILKHTAGQQGLFDGRLDLVGHPVDPSAQGGGPHHLPVAPLEAEILGLEPLPGQMVGHAAHALSDGHPVVVENDDKGLLAVPCVRQTLIGQAAGEGPVTNQGQYTVIFML